MSFIREFFEIFNFRFWLLLVEIFYIPCGMVIGGLIYRARHKEEYDE